LINDNPILSLRLGDDIYFSIQCSVSIAERLTKENVPMAYGGKGRCSGHIKMVMINEKYKGDTLFQKTFHADPLTKKSIKNTGIYPQYYVRDSHPAIINNDIWECVQLEFKRQEQYCSDYNISINHSFNKKNPLSSRIVCSTCGNTLRGLYSKRKGEEHIKYWRCSTFIGENGTEVKGRMFTPRQRNRQSNMQYNIRRRKDHIPCQMYCTDIWLDEGAVEQTFIDAWNNLVGEYDMATLEETDDVLLKYRRQELVKLIDEIGYIEHINLDLMQQVLDHFEAYPDGTLKVVFLAGASFKILYRKS
jgi:site-specific DNA recombinase